MPPQIRADPPTIFSQMLADGENQTLDPSKMIIRSIISTDAVDRSGDIVVPEGLLNAGEYLRNPVVLWAHQRNLPPIGICRRLEIQPDRIIAETQFSSVSPLAVEVFQLYATGVLRGWSIGFLPRKVAPLATNGANRPGLKMVEWDLLEYSAVPIPENPEAITLAIQKGLLSEDLLFGLFGHDFSLGNLHL